MILDAHMEIRDASLIDTTKKSTRLKKARIWCRRHCHHRTACSNSKKRVEQRVIYTFLLQLQMNMALHVYHNDNMWRRVMICNLHQSSNNRHLEFTSTGTNDSLSIDVNNATLYCVTHTKCDSFHLQREISSPPKLPSIK